MTLQIRPIVDDGEEQVVLGIAQDGFTLREQMAPDEADELAQDLREVAENVRKMRSIAENKTKEET